MLAHFLCVCQHRLLYPAKAFRGKSTWSPENSQACHNSQGAFRIPRQSPFHCNPQVILFSFQAMRPGYAGAPSHMSLSDFCKLHVEGEMAVADRFHFISIEKFFT